ncbi:MAG: DUF4158 domain-containing protein [Streptosporangiaceae bacterium]
MIVDTSVSVACGSVSALSQPPRDEDRSPVIDDDELIEHWTLVGDELAEVAGKRGPTRLAFALLLKFCTGRGRFPRSRGELPDEANAYVARQVQVPATDLGLYEWSGRTFEYHRA